MKGIKERFGLCVCAALCSSKRNIPHYHSNLGRADISIGGIFEALFAVLMQVFHRDWIDWKPAFTDKV